MKTALCVALLLTSLTALYSPLSSAADAASAMPQAPQTEAVSSDFSFVNYQADYQVKPDATSVKTESREILLNTKAAVDRFSQIRLSYSEKMETLEVLSAYTLAPDGQRYDVAPDRIYTQESYSSASAPLYADRKVRVIVFSNLAPGSRVVYQVRTTQNTPYFPGYFGLWETFSVFHQFDRAEINLQAPANLSLNIYTRGVKGSNTPKVRNGIAQWQWRYQRSTPMKTAHWSAESWTFSPVIMASTFHEWTQLAKAYQLKAHQAAMVTPATQALADQVTSGISDRRLQAAALYRWVAQNIRYVAVYLGNGGLEPNSAQSILDNRYGDCKDHVVILEALLAAKGIDSSPALIGLDGMPVLPEVPLLERFNHVITYIPDFDMFLDSTGPWARFGQLPRGDLNAPVLLTRTAKLARTPSHDARRERSAINAFFMFDAAGNMTGRTEQTLDEMDEIEARSYLSQVNQQNEAAAEDALMSASGIDGRGRLTLNSDPLDINRPFSYGFQFKADDYVDFGVVGGMTVPVAPGGNHSFRTLYLSTAAPTNEVPFNCEAQRFDERYTLQLPASVPILAIPKDQHFSNKAGDYRVEWRREGQRVMVRHQLEVHAIRGKESLCQGEDYPAFRELFQQVRRGFRGQLVYGELANRASTSSTAH